jgi:hypothetical protein
VTSGIPDWDVVVLALLIAQDMERNPDDFRNAPVPAAALRAQVERFIAAVRACAAAQAGLREEYAARKQSLTLLKQVLRVVKPWAARVLRARSQRFSA